MGKTRENINGNDLQSRIEALEALVKEQSDMIAALFVRAQDAELNLHNMKVRMSGLTEALVEHEQRLKVWGDKDNG